LLEDTPCAIVPAQFLRGWKQWLLHPTQDARPTVIDTESFFCEHQHLILDPNDSADADLRMVAFVKMDDWFILERMLIILIINVTWIAS
jgi:hypothetical protein